MMVIIPDTHVLIWSDEEAMMNISLDQAGFTHTLLPEHDHLGIDAHCCHGLCVRMERELREKEEPLSG